MVSHTSRFFGISKNLFWMKKHKAIAIVFSASFLFAFSFLFSFVPVENALAAARQSTMTMNISTDTISVDLNPSADGRFASSDDATIQVSTDNYSGYTLKIASTNSSDLISENNDTMGSIQSLISEAIFSSDSTYNNEWGYKPSKYVSNNVVVNNTDTYLPSPSSNGDTLDILL